MVACCPGNAKVQPSDGECGVAPPSKRNCHDILFLLVFVVASIASLICMNVGLTKGDPARLLYGTDYNGDACGGKNHPSSLNTIYYPRLDQDLLKAVAGSSSASASAGSAADVAASVKPYGICVTGCPERNEYICNDAGKARLAAAGLTYDGPVNKTKDAGSTAVARFIENNGMIDPQWVRSRGPCWRVESASRAFLFRCLPYSEETRYEKMYCLKGGSTTRIQPRWTYDNTSKPVPAASYRWKEARFAPAAGTHSYPSDCPLAGGAEPTRAACKDLESRIVPDLNCSTVVSVGSSESSPKANPHEGGDTAYMKNPMLDQLKTTSGKIGRWMGDVEKAMDQVLVFGGALAFALGLAWLILLKYCTKMIVWATLWLTVLALLALTLYSAVRADMIGDTSSLGFDSSGLQAQVQSDKEGENEGAFKVLAYVSLVLTLIMFILVLFMRTKIKVSVGILREATNAIKRMPLMLLFPLVPLGFTLLGMFYFVYVGAAIYSADEIDLHNATNSALSAAGASSIGGVNISFAADALAESGAVNATKGYDAKNAMLAYHLFFCLWYNALVAAVAMCTLAGAVCKYYWSRNKTAEEMGKRPIAASFWNCFRYHFGSLCFGSLIIAIVQFVRACLHYLDRKTKGLQDRNLAIKCAMKAVQCCMWCLEKCLKFISRNAYIMIAMKGRSFCAATVEAFSLIFANLSQVAVVSAITGAILTFAKITICAACGFFVVARLDTPRYKEGGSDELSAPLLPVVLTLVLAYFVADCFLYVYELAVDTVLLCFCEDKKVNSGGGEVFMSDELAKYIGAQKPKGETSDEVKPVTPASSDEA